MVRKCGLLMLAVISQLMLSSNAASMETASSSLAPDTNLGNADAANKDTDQKILQLELEKEELLKKIKESLSEVAKDASAAALAQEITSRLNGSLSANDSVEESSETDIPLQLLNARRADETLHKRPLEDKIFDINSLYSKKDRQSKKWKGRMANREIIQAKLDAWLKDRMTEKAKIQAYKNKQKSKSQKHEKCPNYGFQKAKKFRRSNYKKPKDSRGHMYPCCRKCCKKSYMGCL